MEAMIGTRVKEKTLTFSNVPKGKYILLHFGMYESNNSGTEIRHYTASIKENINTHIKEIYQYDYDRPDNKPVIGIFEVTLDDSSDIDVVFGSDVSSSNALAYFNAVLFKY